MDQAGEELGRIIAFVNRRPWIMEDNSNSKCCLHTTTAAAIGASAAGTVSGSTIKSNYFLDRLGVTSFGDSSLHRICAWHTTPEQFQVFLDHLDAHHRTLVTRAAAATTTTTATTIPENNHHDIFMDPIMMTTTTTTTDNTAKTKSCTCQHSTASGMEYRDMPDPPRLDQTNHRGVTALHVAVYRNAFYAHQIVRQLLQQDPTLASMPMTPCGSYPLHVLCGQNVTIRREVLMTLLRADPTVVWKEDVHGDTPLSLLWKNVLRFRWAQQQQQERITLQDDNEEEEEHHHMDISDSSTGSNSSNSNTNSQHQRHHRRRQKRRTSWMTVISPDQYVEYSLLLIRAALGKNINRNNNNTNNEKEEEDLLTLGDVCRMPRCPPLLIQLLLQYPNKFVRVSQYEKDWQGMTPLHHATHVQAMTPQFVPMTVFNRMKQSSVIDILLHAFPSMAYTKDCRGRIPLHYVLEKDCFPNLHHYSSNNKGMNNAVAVDSTYMMGAGSGGGDGGISLIDHKEALYRIIQANPDSLAIQDPVTGLYPFALLASQKTTEQQQGYVEDDEDRMDIDDKPRDSMDRLSSEKERVQLETIMVMLHHFPEAALYSRNN